MKRNHILFKLSCNILLLAPLNLCLPSAIENRNDKELNDLIFVKSSLFTQRSYLDGKKDIAFKHNINNARLSFLQKGTQPRLASFLFLILTKFNIFM